MSVHPRGRLAIAFAITAAFMVVEVIGGLVSGSLALLSDAGHMLADSGALAIALAAASFAGRPADHGHTFGHQRAEVLAAQVNAGGLVVLAVWISVSAIGRLIDPVEIQSGEMMIVAGAGLGVNAAMAFLLRDTGGVNGRAALLNVLGDALGSVGALVAGAMVRWWSWERADAIASLLIAVPGVASVHDLHAWSLRPGEDVVSAHIVVGQGHDALAVCAQVEEALHSALPTAHVTIQPEPSGGP